VFWDPDQQPGSSYEDWLDIQAKRGFSSLAAIPLFTFAHKQSQLVGVLSVGLPALSEGTPHMSLRHREGDLQHLAGFVSAGVIAEHLGFFQEVILRPDLSFLLPLLQLSYLHSLLTEEQIVG
jgi:hypothetical protein